MKVSVRWNKDFFHGSKKPWRVIFEESEILCDDIEFVYPVYTEVIEIPNKGFRSHLSFEVSSIKYVDGKLTFEK